MSNNPNQKKNNKTGKQSAVSVFGVHERLGLISKIIFFGLIAAVLFNFLYQGFFLKKDYPDNTFLFLQSDRFNDFFNMREWCKNMNPYFAPSFLGNSNYLPIANIFFWLFSLFSKQLSLVVYTIVYSVLMYYFTFINIPSTETKTDRRKYAFAITFLSYAFLVCFDRANLEPYVVIPIMAFLFFYQKEKHQLAILFLALAAATKIYPFIFILLYVSDKKYREVALSILYTAILVICPLLLHKGVFEQNFNFILTGFELDTNTSSFVGAFDDKGNQMIQGSSLFSVIKILNIKMNLGLTNMLGKYFVLVGLIAFVTVVYVVLVEKSLWRKVTLLTCLVVMLPHISFDYKLIHFLLCVYLFINEPKDELNPQLNYKTVTILLGLMLIPKSYFYFSKIVTTTTGRNDVPMGTLLNPIIMIVLCFIIIYSGMKYYSRPVFKDALNEHLQAIKKSMVYLLPVALLAIPYYTYSKRAKSDYKVYKKHYLQAQEYLKNNQVNEGLVEYKKAAELKPYRFLLPFQIAGIYNQMGNNDSAKVFYNKTLAIFSECAEAKNSLILIDINGNNAKGVENLNNKKFNEAIESFNKTLDAFNKLPQNSGNNGFITGVYSNMFACYYNLQNWQEAKNCLNKIEAIDPNNQFLQSNKANLDNVLRGLTEKAK